MAEHTSHQSPQLRLYRLIHGLRSAAVERAVLAQQTNQGRQRARIAITETLGCFSVVHLFTAM